MLLSGAMRPIAAHLRQKQKQKDKRETHTSKILFLLVVLIRKVANFFFSLVEFVTLAMPIYYR